MLAGHEILLDAYNTDVRPLCAAVRARNGAAADPVAELRALGYARERPPRGRARASPRSPGGPADERDHPDGRRPSRIAGRATAGRPDDALEEVLFASHLLGANRASRQLRRRQHVGQGHRRRPRRPRGPGDVGQGLGQRPGDDVGRRTSRRCGSHEILPLIERDAMSDEEMVAYLARCQLDPAAPRSSIETLLHAFVPAAHVHHTHPDAINVLACADGGAELIAECFGDQAAWIPYIRPGFTLAKQVGEAVRVRPGPAAGRARQARPGGLGRHRRGGVRADHRACNRAVEFVNRKRPRRCRDSEARARGRAGSTPTPGPRRCGRCCRRCAARSRLSAPRS